MQIDSHHHFWNYSVAEYGWIDDSMQDLRRDFLPEHLEQEIRQVGIDGVVSVQARQSLEETDWLLSLAEANDLIKGVVGWVPLRDADVQERLEKLGGQAKLKAVRHVVQDEPDDEFLLRKPFNQGVSLLHGLGLVYDILIFERHLPATIQFVDRHPNQTFVLDHIAKPQIRKHLLEPWDQNIRELAKRPHVFCKVSGMVTEADFDNWTPAQLQPYWSTILEAFGPSRLMFGSDWPVCLAACEYGRWFHTVKEFASALTASEQASLLGNTAIAAYNLA
jgi:L-fuconolactonase